jgi:choline-sulfatase
MERRNFLKSTLAGGLAADVLPGAARRPNVLFLIADDLTFRGIGALGYPDIHTPNLDRLAKRGVSFTHCFHQGSWLPAVCVASRSMLNSGLTAFHAQRRIEETPLWGETLGKAGYDTCLVGKWHLSKSNLQKSFQQTKTLCPGMFESGPTAYNRPSPGNTWTPWDKSLKGQWLHTTQWQNSAADEIRHSAFILADEASAHLRGRAKEVNPCLLYVGFTSPHDPRQAPKEFVDRYPAGRMEIPPNYLPEHPFDQGDHKIRDEVLAPFPRTREAVQLHRSEYYAHVTYMDEQIGRILDALDDSGLAGNTYVVFTADHGLAVGQHGLMGKQNMYDHSIRMPFLIAGPGLPKGKRTDELVYQHSLFPTMCELTAVPAPKSVEFPGLADLLKGKGREKHDAVFSFYKNFQRAVRTQQHKLIVYPEARVTQLFDLDKDPWEANDLAGKREHAALKSHLLDRLHRFQRELDDDLPLV